ncbi:MAG: G5 domain-containing protein [Oscillospiraceae bacterium]|nr:G5 domain-containing protein [Oscillospiraceae bacterium]
MADLANMIDLQKMLGITRYRVRRLKRQVSRVIKRRNLWQKHVALSALAILTASSVIMSMTGVLFFSTGEAIRPGEAAVSAKDFAWDNPDALPALYKISYRDVTRTELIPYETSYEYSDLIAISDSVVLTQGRYGEWTVVVRETLVNGQVVSTEVVLNEQTRAPVTHVIMEGLALQTPVSTREFPEIRLENGRPVDYVRRLSGRATAYTATPNARTSTGRPLELGIVAVDPRIIPYGSLLYIVSTCGNVVYGSAVAADTGGFIHKPNPTLIDVYMGYTTPENHQLARNWGNQNVDVYIINTGIY